MNLALSAAILLLSSLCCPAQTGKTGGSADASSPRLETMPQSLEVRFALSALPPHLRDGATAYVLDPVAGYIVNRKGTNGLSCIVMRTEWAWPQLAFRDDIYVPICYDEEGSKKMLPVWTDVAQMRARGLTPKQIEARALGHFLYDRAIDAELSRSRRDGGHDHGFASLHVLRPEREKC